MSANPCKPSHLLNVIQSRNSKFTAPPISPPELDVLSHLVSYRESLPPSHQPQKILVFTDVRRDPDDHNALLLLILLHKLALVSLRGIVATSPPTRDRARFAKALLEEHGLREVPVAVGTDNGGDVGRKGQFDCISGHDFQLASEVGDGAQWAGRLLAREVAEGERQVTVLCVAPTLDVAGLFRCFAESWRGIGKFVFQAGVTLHEETGRLEREVGEGISNYNADGINNDALASATAEVLAYLNDHDSIETVFVPKAAAAQAKVPGMQYYQQLREIGEMFSTQFGTTKGLYEQEEEALVELLTSVAMGRSANRRWDPFVTTTFFGGEKVPEPKKRAGRAEREVEEEVRGLVRRVKSMILYDAVAALFTVGGVVERFGLLKQVKSGRHLVVREIDGERVRTLMTACVKASAILGPDFPSCAH